MRRAYEEWNPREETLLQVQRAREIIREYSEQGYVLTLRQLYYQFVARDLIPNKERSYKNLGTVITKARMAGLIDWQAIEDRNRGHHSFYFEEDIFAPLNSLPYGITYDRWARQDVYVEVWVEKEALGNVIAKACEPLDVPHMSCKGYLSASEAWRAGRRMREQVTNGKRCVVIHLGDHDPSGIDMTRDNEQRLRLFAESTAYVDVCRIALNYDQIEEYQPPPNPTKLTDSRAKGYIAEHGYSSWELDALEPSLLERLITQKVKSYIDLDKWNEVDEEEEEKRRVLSNISKRWDEIQPIVEAL